MKNKIFTVAAFALLTLAACTDKKTETTETTSTTEASGDTVEVDGTATATDTVVKPQEAAADEVVTVKGKVEKITPGKDGYTAQIKEMGGKVYNVVISIPNLKDHKQYRKIIVGEIIKVTGPKYMVGTDETVKAEELL